MNYKEESTNVLVDILSRSPILKSISTLVVIAQLEPFMKDVYKKEHEKDSGFGEEYK